MELAAEVAMWEGQASLMRTSSEAEETRFCLFR